jgi:hypothetical protein
VGTTVKSPATTDLKVAFPSVANVSNNGRNRQNHDGKKISHELLSEAGKIVQSRLRDPRIKSQFNQRSGHSKGSPLVEFSEVPVHRLLNRRRQKKRSADCQRCVIFTF